MEFHLSQARPDDLELLVAHRLGMWRDIHPEFGSKVDESEGLTRQWIRERLSDGTLVGFIVRVEDGRVAGSGCIWLRNEQPRPTNPRMVVPYLMSMYTERAFRRKGVGRLIVKSALEWCRERDYDRVVLHASAAGRPLYEEFGFEPASEMRLRF